MKIVLAALCVLGVVTSAQANNDVNKVRSYVAQLKKLQAAGVSIHKRYRLDDLAEVKACVAKNGGLRETAKKLKEQAWADTALDPYYRPDLIEAVDATFVCLYCKEVHDECKVARSSLKALEGKMGKASAPQKEESPEKLKW